MHLCVCLCQINYLKKKQEEYGESNEAEILMITKIQKVELPSCRVHVGCLSTIAIQLQLAPF